MVYRKRKATISAGSEYHFGATKKGGEKREKNLFNTLGYNGIQIVYFSAIYSVVKELSE